MSIAILCFFLQHRYDHPVPKALVALWQALVHLGAGIKSEGVFRVTGSKEEIAASKEFLENSGVWSKKKVGKDLAPLFTKEFWEGQEHPTDAFCAGIE